MPEDSIFNRLLKSKGYGLFTLLLVLAIAGLGLLDPLAERHADAASGQNRQVIDTSPGPDVVAPTGLVNGQVARKTQYSRTVLKPDGIYSTTFSTRPLYWKNRQTGKWMDFDNHLQSLSSDPDYSYQDSSNGYTVSFGKPGGVVAGKPVMRVSSGNTSIKITAIDAKPNNLTVNGSKITYTDAYTNTDDEFTVDNERVKESIVIKSQTDVTADLPYTYKLDLSGVTPQKNSDGSVDFVDSAGNARFRMLAPFMEDASGATSTAVAVSLGQQGQGSYALTVSPDAAWLADPSVEQVSYQPDEPSGQDATVNQDYPSSNFDYQDQVQVGKKATGSKWDALVAFPDLDSLPKDSVVVDATMRLWGHSGSTGMPVAAYANTGAWKDSTVNWNNAPAVSSTVYDSETVSSGQWNSFNLTSLARSWVRGDSPDYGVRLTSTGANGPMVAFTSSRSTATAERPRLVVDYVAPGRYGSNDALTYTASQDYGGGTTSEVEASTGNLVLSHDNGSIDARGFGVDLTSTYNSQDQYGQTNLYDRPGAWYGEGWTLSQNQRLYEIDNGKAVVFKDDAGGANRVFVQDGVDSATNTQSYYAPLYYDYSLTKDLSSTADPKRVYTLRPLNSRLAMYFDGGGKLRHVEDGNGNYLDYAYDTDSTSIGDPNGKLATITDVAGRTTTFQYNGTGGRLSQITDMAGRATTFTYSSFGNLLSITDAAGTPDAATTKFAYSMGDHLLSVTNPRGYTSPISYKAQDTWDASGDAEGWAADGSATAPAQTTAPSGAPGRSS